MTKIDIEWSSPSEMVTLYEYYGEAKGSVVGRKVMDFAIEDRVHTEMKTIPNDKYPEVRAYPRTWLDKLDFIDRVHETGAKSDKDIVNQIKLDFEKDEKRKKA